MSRVIAVLVVVSWLAGCTKKNHAAIGIATGASIVGIGSIILVTGNSREGQLGNGRAFSFAVMGLGGVVLLASLANYLVLAGQSASQPTTTPTPTGSGVSALHEERVRVVRQQPVRRLQRHELERAVTVEIAGAKVVVRDAVAE